MVKILFVCHGNICRSPMAEFIMKKLVKEQGLENEFIIDSAATSTEELGNDIYPPAKQCLKRHEISFVSRHSRQINSADLNKYDYIIAMEEYNIGNIKRLVGDSNKYSLLLDYTGEKGDISDPWYTGDFETAYKEILNGCESLIEHIKKG